MTGYGDNTYHVIRITRKTFVPFYFLPGLAGVKNLSIYFWVPYQVLFLFKEMETELLKLLRLNNFWSEYLFDYLRFD